MSRPSNLTLWCKEIRSNFTIFFKFINCKYSVFGLQALCAQGSHVTYDPTGLAQNGVTAQHMIPAAAYNRFASQPLTTYPLPAPTHWPMQYVMQPPPHMAPVDNHGVLQMMAPDPTGTVQYANMIPQLTTQMHALQLTTAQPVTIRCWLFLIKLTSYCV